jgi:hypothetical protein
MPNKAAREWTTLNEVTPMAILTVCGITAVLNYNSGPVTSNGSTSWQINALVPDGVAGQRRVPWW